MSASALALLCAASLNAPLPARAQQPNLVLGLASGLVQRGVAREPDAPTLLAGVDLYPAEGWTVGVSGALLRAAARGGQSLQLISQLGYAWPLADDWQAQLGYLHYEYPLDDRPSLLRYDTLRASLSYSDLVTLSVSASPNARAGYASPFRSAWGSSGRGMLAYDLSGRWPLAPRLFADAGLGYMDLQRLLGAGYVYGNLGASLLWGDTQWSLGYIATGAEAKRLFPGHADNRWAFSVVWQR